VSECWFSGNVNGPVRFLEREIVSWKQGKNMKAHEEGEMPDSLSLQDGKDVLFRNVNN
jgi:hypothetical protein